MLAALLPLPAGACDICGCFMGITPYDNQSSLVLLHRYRVFQGQPGQFSPRFVQPGQGFLLASPLNQAGRGHSHTGGTGASTGGHSHDEFEVFRTMELRATAFVHPRVELLLFVPYNSYSFGGEGGSTSHNSGLGDVSTLLGYHLIRRVDFEEVQMRLVAGGGIKWPTGKFYAKDAEGRRLPLASQLGTGSTDYSLFLRYNLGWRKLGLAATVAYRISSQNYYQQRLGNGSTLFANFFTRFKLGQKVIVLPAIQNIVEHTRGELLAGQEVGNHRLTAWSAGPGLDMYIDNISIHAGVKATVWQNNSGHAPSAGQWLLGLGYNLNQNRYPLGRGAAGAGA